MVKKISFVILICLGLFGCTPNQTIESDPVVDELMSQIETFLPEEVYQELNNDDQDVFTINESNEKIISIANAKEDPTLRLDFVFQDDKLVQYVSKEYGFVDNELKDDVIDESQAIELAQTFSKTFLNKENTFTVSEPLSGYDTPDYLTLVDQDSNIYLIQLNKNMLINYEDYQYLTTEQ